MSLQTLNRLFLMLPL